MVLSLQVPTRKLSVAGRQLTDGPLSVVILMFSAGKKSILGLGLNHTLSFNDGTLLDLSY